LPYEYAGDVDSSSVGFAWNGGLDPNAGMPPPPADELESTGLLLRRTSAAVELGESTRGASAYMNGGVKRGELPSLPTPSLRLVEDDSDDGEWPCES
jgi:hypothetical protein